MKNNNYRKGVGIIIINSNKEILIFKRNDVKNSWQCPEGGIDENEIARNSALRELEEETGVSKDKVRIIARTNSFISYKFPEEAKAWKDFIGQKKKFFLMEFSGNDSDINLKTKHPEFSNFKWIQASELLGYIIDFKKPMYKQVLQEFFESLKENSGDRLAKYIARTGYCSKREAEKLIEECCVKVNGKVTTDFSTRITEQSIKINNKVINKKEKTDLWIFHKPKGVVVTRSDENDRKTIYNVLPTEFKNKLAIGRLDINTEGLLLLTNNGELSRYISLPSTAWTRKYRVRVYGKLKRDIFDRINQRGISIRGIRYQNIKIEIDKERDFNSWLIVSLKEGKNREIKNILEYTGLQVTRLIRIVFGTFQLGSLPEGQIKEIPFKTIKEVIGNKVSL